MIDKQLALTIVLTCILGLLGQAVYRAEVHRNQENIISVQDKLAVVDSEDENEKQETTEESPIDTDTKTKRE